MSAPKYSSILLYGSTTASAIPAATNLTTSANGVEVAVNAADGKMYFKDPGGNVTLLANKEMANPTNVALTGGSINGVTIGATTPAPGTFSALTLSGTAPITLNGSVGTAGQVLTSGGPGVAPSWTTVSGGGGGTGTVSYVGLSAPAFLTVTNSPITTTGTLTLSLSGTALPVTSGGTGQTSLQAAINSLAGAVTAGTFLRGNGTNVTMSAIQASDVPTLNQNTTGTAANVTGVVAVANGGTGATTLSGFLVGNGTSAVTAVSTIPNSGLTNSSVTLGTTSVALGATATTISGLTLSSPTVSTSLSLGATTTISLNGSVGTAGQILTSAGPGATPTWSPAPVNGVTSVGVSVPAFLSVSNSPVTSSGTIAISYSGSALPIANGGTGATTQQGAINALAGAVTAGSFLRGNGTNVTMSAIQVGDVPTLNQNTTGTAANVTGVVAVANGGTGATTLTGLVKGNGTAAMTAAVAGTDYAPATSGSSILYGNGSGGFSNVTVGSGLSFTGGTLTATGSGGTVTTVSVVSANGFAGTVATASSTPAITLSTTVSGILQGNGTAISAAATTGSGSVVLATSPVITTPQIGQINDASAKAVTVFSSTASAVNWLTFTNSATLNGPTISSAGGDTNVDLNLSTKGTGVIKLNGVQAADISSAQTLTNKAISGGSNTFSNIPNSALTNSSVTVNGTAIALGGSGTVTAAAGTLTGTTLAANVVSSSLTTVGTITSGTWNGSTVDVAHGGTGATTITGLVKGNGTSAFTAAVSGVDYAPASASSYATNALSTGVLTGAAITGTVGGTTFNVGATTGIIVNNETNPASPTITQVNFAGATNITPAFLTTATQTYVLLDNTGTLQYLNTFPTPQQRRQMIFLGFVAHANKTVITVLSPMPDVAYSSLAQVREFLQPIRIINSGISTYANGANLTFNTTAGYLSSFGLNFTSSTYSPSQVPLAALNPVSFLYRTQTGGNATLYTNIDPLNYDVAGTITAISGSTNQATCQRIYVGLNGAFAVQYGQAIYQNLAAAIGGAAGEAFTVFPNLVQNAVLIGILCVTKGCTSLNDTNNARFLAVSKFGESIGASAGISTATLQSAYNNSVVPQIVTNSTLGGLMMQRGSAADTDLVLAIMNGSGAITAAINGNGAYTSGTWNATTIDTAYGGTGLTGFTSGGALYATSATTLTTGTLPVASGGTGVTTSTGSGSVVRATSPSLVTPNLGTPSAVTLTNATGLPLTTGVTGTLPLASGGTGATTQAGAANAVLPTQTGNAGKFLSTDGTNVSWQSTTGSTVSYTRTTVTVATTVSSFNVSYTVGYLQVFVNSGLLAPADYTATDGATVVLTTAASAGDLVEFFAYSTLAIGVASAVSGGTTGQILYQTAPGTTGFTSGITTDGSSLTFSGTYSTSAPQIQQSGTFYLSPNAGAAGPSNTFSFSGVGSTLTLPYAFNVNANTSGGTVTTPDNAGGTGYALQLKSGTGTGAASNTGGNGYVAILGGGATSAWTAFATVAQARRRGGILLQPGLAALNSSGTVASGSLVTIQGTNAVTDGTTATGVGSSIQLFSGSGTTTGGVLNGGASLSVNGGSSSSGGAVTFSGGAAGSGSGANGGGVNISSGQGDSAGQGGTINITAASGGSTTGAGGSININAGASNGSSTGAAGTVTITGGTGNTVTSGGSVNIYSGASATVYAPIMTLNGSSSTAGGDVSISAGYNNTGTNVAGGNVTLYGGNGAGTSNAGNVSLSAGNASGSGNGGTLNLSSGIASGSGAAGNVQITAATSGSGTKGAIVFNTAVGQVMKIDGAGALGLGASGLTGTAGQFLMSNGAGAVPSWGSAVSVSAQNTWTDTQTFSGSTSTFAIALKNAKELTNIIAAAPSATQTVYVNNGAVQYFTTNAANNWTINIAFSSGTSLNTAMSIGDSVTVAIMATQGATAYYQSAYQIDGSAVTPKWLGGTAPTAGNASGIDVYNLTIIKTASATYTVLASQSQYK